MSESHSRRQTILFLLFLAGLFILAWIAVPRLPPPSTAGDARAATTTAPTPTQGPACVEQAAQFLVDIDQLMQEWNDTTSLAGSLPRDQLAGTIVQLQNIRRRVQGLKPPDCAAAIQQNASRGMELATQAYIDALAQKPDQDVQAQFDKAKPFFVAYRADMRRLLTPTPTPEQGATSTRKLPLARFSL